VIDETIKAFSVSATSATGYGSAGAPSGRYFAPANGPDCIEPDNGAGTASAACARSSSPGRCTSSTTSASASASTSWALELRVPLEMLNAFNHHNFTPVAGIGSTLSNYEVTASAHQPGAGHPGGHPDQLVSSIGPAGLRFPPGALRAPASSFQPPASRHVRFARASSYRSLTVLDHGSHGSHGSPPGNHIAGGVGGAALTRHAAVAPREARRTGVGGPDHKRHSILAGACDPAPDACQAPTSGRRNRSASVRSV